MTQGVEAVIVDHLFLFHKGLVLIVATLVERLHLRAAAHSLPPDETKVEVTSL